MVFPFLENGFQMNITKQDIGKLVMCIDDNPSYDTGHGLTQKLIPSRKCDPHGPYEITSVTKHGEVELRHAETGKRIGTTGKWIILREPALGNHIAAIDEMGTD